MILRHTFIPSDNRRLAHLCGALDEHLRAIEASLNVSIRRRNETFRVEGAKRGAERAMALLQLLHEQARHPIPAEEFQLLLVQAVRLDLPSGVTGVVVADDDESAAGLAHDGAVTSPLVPADAPVLRTRRTDLSGRTPTQLSYLHNIQTHDITLGVGPAGTGKTFLAVACAVDALERSSVQRIVLTRPAVEAGERLGFLPGDLTQKIDPYLRPLYDALHDLMGSDRVAKAVEKGQLEIAPLAFMRGRTLNHAFMILDEAQNTTPEQMKMFLTRLGFGSKAVITGDVSQIDLPRGTTSGLIDAVRVLRQVSGVATTRFSSADVVRHPLVARIVEAYDAADQGHRPAPTSRAAGAARPRAARAAGAASASLSSLHDEI